jgi:hypothetical protein
MARALDCLTDGPEWKPAFVFRTGYARHTVPHSPRRPIESVMTKRRTV